jgi:hypothetical protein
MSRHQGDRFNLSGSGATGGSAANPGALRDRLAALDEDVFQLADSWSLDERLERLRAALDRILGEDEDG